MHVHEQPARALTPHESTAAWLQGTGTHSGVFKTCALLINLAALFCASKTFKAQLFFGCFFFLSFLVSFFFPFCTRCSKYGDRANCFSRLWQNISAPAPTVTALDSPRRTARETDNAAIARGETAWARRH